MRFGWCVFPLVVSLCGAVQVASARVALAQAAPPSQPTQLDAATEARRSALFESGRTLHLEGKHAEAVEKLGEVVQIRKSPQALRALGLAEAAAGKLVAAKAHLEQALKMATDVGPPGEVGPAKQALGEVVPRLPRVRVVLPANVGQATVLMDDSALAPAGGTIDVDPGPHTVTAAAPGKALFTRTVQAVEGEVVEVNVELLALPRAAALRRPLGIGLAAAGGAGLVLGAVTGILAIGAHDELATKCPAGACPSDQRASLDGYHALATTATVGLIAGGVLAAAGTVLLLTAPPSGSSTALRVTPFVGLSVVGARVQF